MVPSCIAITSDAWTADTTKASFLGLTGHWIEVKNEGDGQKWILRSEVLGYRAISGQHSGSNLGRHLIALCKHAGILSKEKSKVFMHSDLTDID